MIWPALQVLAVALLAPEVEPGLERFAQRMPGCDPPPSLCAGIAVHFTVDGSDRRPLSSATPAWLRAQLRHAKRLFAPAGVSFMLRRLAWERAAPAVIRTRTDRDGVLRSNASARVVHVVVVAELWDVDDPSVEIRGVHWRRRSALEERYVLLSAKSEAPVLAHELGHFFGLPHSSYRVSVMNKRPREQPSFEARTFHPRELAALRDDAVASLQAPGGLESPWPWPRFDREDLVSDRGEPVKDAPESLRLRP